MEKIRQPVKRRGFISSSSESTADSRALDYGPLGVELKRNLKKLLVARHGTQRDDVVGMAGAILTHPAFHGAGHVEGFSDPMIDCRTSGPLRAITREKKKLAMPNAAAKIYEAHSSIIRSEKLRRGRRRETAGCVRIAPSIRPRHRARAP